MTGIRGRSTLQSHGRGHESTRFRLPRISVARGIILLLCSLLLWFLLRAPQAGADAARHGLSLAATVVIPALFPFFVLASLLAESGVGEAVGKPLSRSVGRFLGVSGAGVTVLLLGSFCGFPVGARMISAYAERGILSKKEQKRLLPLSNSPSFAFLYSAVGAGMLGDPSVGLRLYGALLLGVLTAAVLLRLTGGTCADESKPTALPPASGAASVSILPRAVTSAALSALSVTGFLVFFSVLSAALSALLTALHAGETVSLLLSGLLELTTGVKKAAETAYGLCGKATLCGFFAGFGGLCASLQVIATVERPLPDRAPRDTFSLRSYCFIRLLIGLLTALYTLLFTAF